MQIHEITTLNENFLKRLATDARKDAFKKSTGVDLNTYKLAQTAGQSVPAATTVTPAPMPGRPQGGGKVARATPSQTPGAVKKRAARAARAAAVANPSAAPVVYRFDGRALDPRISGDAVIIKTLQAAGVTSATSS